MLGDKLAELALFASNASPRADVSSPKPDDGRTALAGLVMSFGSFHVLPYQRLLLEGDRPVRLGSRAFDILTALVERAGEVVSKDELMARAWPQTFVEEANLRIQVSAVRRALGDGQAGHRYVVTVPGRGYNFVAPVSHGGGAVPASPRPTMAPAGMHNLPHAVTLRRRLYGRGCRSRGHRHLSGVSWRHGGTAHSRRP